MLRLLVIDDEEDIRDLIALYARKAGYEVARAADGAAALAALQAEPYDLAICDVRMPRMSGLELLDEARASQMGTAFVMMSAFGSRELAVDAIKRGAYDYFSKPFSRDEVVVALAKASERLALERENESLRADLGRTRGADPLSGLVGRSEPMERVAELARRVAAFRSTVLISGESGTGKEVVARAIHALSPRAEGPWVAINCGAIPDSLIESELFGHAKGAFTDAASARPGLFETASGGTLFLDEVAELPLATQVKLLRVLQEGEIRRIGESRARPIDVRIVAASLHELEARVEAGSFREDLYYRLNVIRIELPPLRARGDDLEALVEHFIAVQNARLGASIRGVEPEAMATLRAYAWPGNVRELQNCVERGVVLATGDLLRRADLPRKVREASDELALLFADEDNLSVKVMGTRLERILITRALTRTKGNRSQAAKLLELSHRALLYKIKEYGLERVGYEEAR